MKIQQQYTLNVSSLDPSKVIGNYLYELENDLGNDVTYYFDRIKHMIVGKDSRNQLMSPTNNIRDHIFNLNSNVLSKKTNTQPETAVFGENPNHFIEGVHAKSIEDIGAMTYDNPCNEHIEMLTSNLPNSKKSLNNSKREPRFPSCIDPKTYKNYIMPNGQLALG